MIKYYFTNNFTKILQLLLHTNAYHLVKLTFFYSFFLFNSIMNYLFLIFVSIKINKTEYRSANSKKFIINNV